MDDGSNPDDSMNRHSSESTSQRVNASSLSIGFMQKCPHCAVGKLYTGLLEVTETCGHCGFDLSARDPGDGPAFFVIVIMGLLVVLLALWLNAVFHPSLWVHALLWVPLTIGGSVYLLRLVKSLLIAYQYKLKIGFK